jgi:fumarate hydratase subunit alpha
MKTISAEKIKGTISDLCLQANFILRPDVLRALQTAYRREKSARARKLLQAIMANALTARREKLAICQDTGLPVVFAEIGQEVKVSGDLTAAIHKGVALGYKKGYLRNSVVKDTLKRGTPGYIPAVIHTNIVKGNKIKLTVLPKGFGCENKAQLKMFKPTANIAEIKKFIVDTVKAAGPDACPPYVVGVGIGGTADYAALLAKKALLRKVRSQKSEVRSQSAKLEGALLDEINRLDIGPMGLGGKTTALAVHIETCPTHIAGLPVAVNISCHALRSASISL